jgi:hypothetical protein
LAKAAVGDEVADRDLEHEQGHDRNRDEGHEEPEREPAVDLVDDRGQRKPRPTQHRAHEGEQEEHPQRDEGQAGGGLQQVGGEAARGGRGKGEGVHGAVAREHVGVVRYTVDVEGRPEAQGSAAQPQEHRRGIDDGRSARGAEDDLAGERVVGDEGDRAVADRALGGGAEQDRVRVVAT